MPYKGERPLLVRMVISLSNEIFTYLRASPTTVSHPSRAGTRKNFGQKTRDREPASWNFFHNSGAPEGITQTKTKGSAPIFFS